MRFAPVKSNAAWLSGCIGTAVLWVLLWEEGLGWLLIPLLWTINLIVFRPGNENAQLEVDIQKQELRLKIEQNKAKLAE